MSTALATVTNASPVQPKAKEKRALKVKGKLKAALDLMVYGDEESLVYDFLAAARRVNYSPVAMRKQLQADHVRRYLMQQKQVFRESASAQNISRAIELRDQDENKTAAIQAIRYLDGEGSQGKAVNVGVHVNVTPGIVFDLREQKAEPELTEQPLIEVNPSHSNDDVGNERFPTSGNSDDGGG